MGHTVSRNKSQAEKVAAAMNTNEASSPIMTESGAKMGAAAQEKLRRLDSEQCLTEEMIEGLTRSSTSSTRSKAKKKDALKDWIAAANYVVEHDMDALKRHEDSMHALVAMQKAKHELRGFSKLDHCSSSRSKDSKRKGTLDTFKSRS
ncbi:hypothetical protein CUR178_05072 [Leishmania enriettii]|uniref:Uncharacterized protein n=1 Tax=Leishmania enriettii TaxID=5663 RepID=A0A836KMC6_LEIEN|nr:hypothetical protein CUR178_05072 [Leishmania enriettii]